MKLKEYGCWVELLYIPVFSLRFHSICSFYMDDVSLAYNKADLLAKEDAGSIPDIKSIIIAAMSVDSHSIPVMISICKHDLPIRSQRFDLIYDGNGAARMVMRPEYSY